MIQKNPNIDLDSIQQKYGDYINGAEMKMFQKAAQTQAKVDASSMTSRMRNSPSANSMICNVHKGVN